MSVAADSVKDMIRNGADWDGEAPCMPDPDVEAWADAPWGEQAPEPELAAADVALQLSRGRSHHKVIDCQELMWIAHWADLHPGPEQAPTVPGAERAITIGGDGTPRDRRVLHRRTGRGSWCQRRDRTVDDR